MNRPAARRRATRMATSVATSTALAIAAAAAVVGLAAAANDRGPDTSRPCGTLDLSHPATQHCFPFDGSHHCTLADAPVSAPAAAHARRWGDGRALSGLGGFLFLSSFVSSHARLLTHPCCVFSPHCFASMHPCCFFSALLSMGVPTFPLPTFPPLLPPLGQLSAVWTFRQWTMMRPRMAMSTLWATSSDRRRPTAATVGAPAPKRSALTNSAGGWRGTKTAPAGRASAPTRGASAPTTRARVGGRGTAACDGADRGIGG